MPCGNCDSWQIRCERARELLESARLLSDQRRVLLENAEAVRVALAATLQNALARLGEMAPPEAAAVPAP